METFEIGSSPYGEDCAQLGTDDYTRRARAECTAFVNQLRRHFGEEPPAARLRVKGFPHDFGTYYEAVIVYDCEDEAAANYADRVMGSGPEKWDDAAREELRAHGIDPDARPTPQMGW